MKKNSFRFLWVVGGLLCLMLGTIGLILPILPTVPFYMATTFCFARSSEKLHQWFLGTEVYKKHLESFVKQKAMTMKTKCSIFVMVTIVMGFAFFMMKNVLIGRISLFLVWLFHLLYFFFRVRTINENEKEEISYD
ncbi:YbaN family protein [Anaerostipes sp.]|uniref:YbaN family protein n=1 Tax=Anaerostipes sp. TaxID=1872530 RepID=UPI003FEE26D7